MDRFWIHSLVMWLIILSIVVMAGRIIDKQEVENSSLYNVYGMPMIQGNTLLPISTIEFPHTQVLADKIVNCESGDNHLVCEDGGYCDGGLAYGKWQFHEKTFYWLAGLAGYKNLNWKNEDDQDLVGMWSLEHGYAYLWTCNKLIK